MDPLCYDARGKVKSDVQKRVVAATRDIAVPEFCYSFLTVSAQLEKGAKLGLLLKKDTVVSIRTTSPFQGVLQSGDVITHVNKVFLPPEQDNIAEALKNAKGKTDITIGRLKRHMVIKPDPKNYNMQDGYDYEYKVMYFMRGMSLGLDIRDIDGKVYVASVLPDSIAGMSLTPGECILEVEIEKVNSVAHCSKVMTESMKRAGYCRVCVETPNQDYIKNMIRAKIQSCFPPESLPKDYEAPAELRLVVEAGLTELDKAEKMEVKPILIESEQKRTERISFVDTVREHTVIMDATSRLLVAVPPPKKTEPEQNGGRTSD